jgi:hypothetical protein
MNKIPQKLSEDDYIRPKITLTDGLQNKKSIQKYLAEYEEVDEEEIPYLTPGMHLRYISWDKENNCELFRLGGILVKIAKEYMVLSGVKAKTFSVQRYAYDKNNNIIHITRFFKKIKNDEIIKKKVNETMEVSKEIIQEQSKMLQKQNEELQKLKKQMKQMKKNKNPK